MLPMKTNSREETDSLLEGDGFEPSVPYKKQPFLAAPVRFRNSPSATNTGPFGDRWFESISLQRRVRRTPCGRVTNGTRARVVGIGIETADMLVNEVLSRSMRDRRAVARYAGLTGAPDESGAKRREQG